MDSNITLQTKQMIDSLKAVCTNFGLGNASSEYKIITEVFLYKFLNDKFLFEAKRVEPALAKLSPADAEKQLAQMTDDDYELFLLGFDPDTAKLKQTHFISYLFNRKNEENFHIQMDARPDGFATVIMDELNQDKVKQLKDACHRMMVEGDFVKYENVYHGVLTECSSQSAGIQLADYAVGIMNGYLRKHLMSRGDYTFATDLYTEFVLPHLRKHANGTVVGYGVREVPSDSSIRQVLMPLFN